MVRDRGSYQKLNLSYNSDLIGFFAFHFLSFCVEDDDVDDDDFDVDFFNFGFSFCN